MERAGKTKNRDEKGIALLEVIVALALLGIISVLFLSGIANSSAARARADERASAKILAESVIDSVKKMDYSVNYTAALPDGYPDYAAVLSAVYLDSQDIQKISVTIQHHGRDILTLENYKVNR